MWRSAALLFAASSACAEPVFTPVDIPAHVYSGGWEHFVGGGLAVFDCNGDGLPELAAAGGEAPVTLLRNTSDGAVAFEATTLPYTGVTGLYPLALNDDAYPDLILLRVGENIALKGGAECTFSALDLPETGARWTTAFSATWEAGHRQPTLAFGHYVDRSDPDGPFGACDINHLMRPAPQGWTVQELTPGHCPLSMLFTDWNRTGRADLRVSNDRHYYVRDGQEQLWAMEPEPRLFTPDDGWEKHQLWGMGIASRDISGDGLPDVYLTSMGDQRLQTRVGDGPTYADVPFETGTSVHRPFTGGDGRPSTGWHVAFGDVTNNGLDDILVTKGNVEQMPGMAMDDPNNLLVQAPDGTFSEAADTAGLLSFHRARGGALADFNGDGLLDIAVVNRRAPLEIWQNTSTATGHWLSLKLAQDGPNPDAIGAWLELRVDGKIHTREITVGGGHAGGTLGPEHFGLGQAGFAEVRVIWPHAGPSDWVTLTKNQSLILRKSGSDLSVSPY